MRFPLSTSSWSTLPKTTSEGANRLYDAWLQKSGDEAVLTDFEDKELVAEAAENRDDTVFQYTVGQILALRENYTEGAKLPVRCMRSEERRVGKAGVRTF